MVLEVDRPILLRMGVGRVCGDPLNNGVAYEGTGRIDVTLQDTVIGEYYFSLITRVAEIAVGDSARTTFTLYVDDNLVHNAHQVYRGGGLEVNAIWAVSDDYNSGFIPFANGFAFWFLESCVESGKFTTLAIPPTYSCSQQIRWSPEADLIQFKVLQGAELGEFRTREGTLLGSEFQLRADDAINMKFIAKQPLDQGGTVELEATVRDLRRTTIINVFTPDDLALALSTSGGVQEGQEMELVARTVACGGVDAEPDPAVTYTFRLIEGNQWGTLFDRATEQQGDSISGVAQFRGEAGVFFRAWEQSPTEPQRVVVEVSASNLTIDPATAELFVVPGGLQITATPRTLAYGEKATIEVRKLLPNGTTEPLAPEATITYRIVGGAAAGLLQNADSTESGDELVSSQSQMLFSAHEEEPQPDSVEVVIQIEVDEGIIISAAHGQGQQNIQGKANTSTSKPQLSKGSAASSSFFGLSGVARVTVKKEEEFDHFKVTLEEDTVAFTEATKIMVKAKDADSQDVAFDTSALLRLSVTQNEEFGTFIDKNGDTLKTSPVKLENISYGDAQAGLIRFAAVKKNPDSAIKCKIKVELHSDPWKHGGKEIVVVEQTLKIVMTAPFEVQPVIPPTVVNTPRAENRKQFTVRLTRGGKPVPNHPFQLTTDYVDGSGGHDHVSPRRIVSRGNYGHFILRRTNTHQDGPYDGETQSNGGEELDYVASIFGDTILIRANSRRNQLLWDTITVAEKVPNLQLIGPGANYELIGGTCNHHGPGGVGTCATPDNNHWGDSTVLTNMQRIATAWNQELPNEEVIQINDISLPHGGKFDVEGSWTGAHETHRTGRDVDIRTDLFFFRNGPLQHRIGIPIRRPRNLPFNMIDNEEQLNAQSRLVGNLIFERFCREQNAAAAIHLPNSRFEHYHLDFD